MGVIIAALIVIAVVAILAGYKWLHTPAKPDLMLSNYPELFKKDVMIVIGENAGQIEMEGAQAIA